jgi:hypothetical protein
MPPIKLRHFLYLDSDLTNEFLAQVEGGLFDEEEQSTTGTSDKAVGGGVSAGPVQAGAGRGSSQEEARARLVRQTQESAFNRLAGLLEQTESVQWLESLDEEIFAQLSRGEVLEIEAVLEVPLLVKLIVSASQMETVGQLMETMGQQFDAKALQGMQALVAIGGLFQSVPVIAAAAGSPTYKFIAQINPAHLRVAIDQLDGEARIFATLDRKLREGEQVSILDAIPVLRSLPDRDEVEANLQDEQSRQFVGEPVTPPAAVVSAIAIYR